ncbi:MAG: MATE family efflux transporter [Pseudomonadota bacterium]
MARRGLPAWLRASDILDLLRLSVPIAVTRMSMMLMSVTDAIVLGQYAPGELPFVLNSWLPIGVGLGAGLGLLLGVQVLTSEMMGTDDTADTGRVFRRGLKMSILFGLGLGVGIWLLAGPLFHWMFVVLSPSEEMSATLSPAEVAHRTAAVTEILAWSMPAFMVSAAASYYLEALRRPLIVTVLSYGGVIINLLLDLAFVGGWWGMPAMGAEGVAIATSGSRWAITIAVLIAVFLLTPGFKPSRAGPADEGRRQVTVGAGTAISNVAEWGGFNFTFIIATWVSLVVNTAYGYSIQVMGVIFMLYMGIGTATSVRVAEAFGRAHQDGVRDAGRLGVAATVLVGLVFGVLTYVFSTSISEVFVAADAVMDGVLLAPLIASLLIYVAFVSLFDGLQAVPAMALRAQEIVWVPTAFHLGSFFLVMIPACYWLAIGLDRGAQGMMEGAMIGVGLAALLQTVYLEYRTARHRGDAPHPLSTGEAKS